MSPYDTAWSLGWCHIMTPDFLETCKTRWWFQNMFYFLPDPCKNSQFLTDIFWIGFFNHPTRSISSGKHQKLSVAAIREELSEAKDVKMLLILLNAPWRNWEKTVQDCAGWWAKNHRFQENASSTFKGFIFQPSMLYSGGFFSRILIGISEQNPINRRHHLVVVFKRLFCGWQQRMTRWPELAPLPPIQFTLQGFRSYACWVVGSNMFNFHPKLGEMIPKLTSIFFQMGWFNHRPSLGFFSATSNAMGFCFQQKPTSWELEISHTIFRDLWIKNCWTFVGLELNSLAVSDFFFRKKWYQMDDGREGSTHVTPRRSTEDP